MLPVDIPALTFQISMTSKTAIDARPCKVSAAYELEL
jgi:hypothetical protein